MKRIEKGRLVSREHQIQGEREESNHMEIKKKKWLLEEVEEEDEEVDVVDVLEEEAEEEEADGVDADVAEAEAEEEAVIVEKKGGHLLIKLASAARKQKMATKTTMSSSERPLT